MAKDKVMQDVNEEITKASVQTDSINIKFNKKQILKSNKYVDRRDVLNVILKDDKVYTVIEIDKLLDDFLNSSIKRGGN